MEEKETKESGGPVRRGVITVGSGMVLLTAVAVALLLLVVGVGSRNDGVALAGEFIFPLSLLAGGLFWVEESLAVRITLIALGGLFVIVAFGNLYPL